jgi:predicted nuclease of restriction endonuclease-like (RecB) superfamily
MMASAKPKGKPSAPIKSKAHSAAQVVERVVAILEEARARVARTVNSTQVVANWLVGREIVEGEQAGARKSGYGERLMEDLSGALTARFGRGYSSTNLRWFRQFYLEYPELLSIHHALRDESGAPARLSSTGIHHAVRDESSIAPPSTVQPGVLNTNLSWTHYRLLLTVDRKPARAFYEIEAAKNRWSARELERQMASLLFDRLAKSKNKAGLMQLATQGQEVAKPIDVLKDPMVMEFLDLPASPALVESKLEQGLIDNLTQFLLELGKGFAFVSRQERITLDGDHFYIDLVFYHVILKCYVVIDLKVGKLTHGDLGQIQFYVNYFDRERRTEGDGPTLGLILCSDKNDAVVKYTLGEQQKRNIFTSRYQLHLPTEKELQAEIQREMRFLAPPSQPSRSKSKRGKA